jgi:hypothetical protein
MLRLMMATRRLCSSLGHEIQNSNMATCSKQPGAAAHIDRWLWQVAGHQHVGVAPGGCAVREAESALIVGAARHARDHGAGGYEVGFDSLPSSHQAGQVHPPAKEAGSAAARHEPAPRGRGGC